MSRSLELVVLYMEMWWIMLLWEHINEYSVKMAYLRLSFLLYINHVFYKYNLFIYNQIKRLPNQFQIFLEANSTIRKEEMISSADSF